MDGTLPMIWRPFSEFLKSGGKIQTALLADLGTYRQLRAVGQLYTKPFGLCNVILVRDTSATAPAGREREVVDSAVAGPPKYGETDGKN